MTETNNHREKENAKKLDWAARNDQSGLDTYIMKNDLSAAVYPQPAAGRVCRSMQLAMAARLSYLATRPRFSTIPDPRSQIDIVLYLTRL